MISKGSFVLVCGATLWFFVLRGDAGHALVFVSFSMPANSLHSLAVLSRGGRARMVVASAWCWGQCTVPFWARLSRQTGVRIDINPSLFKQHHITKVPAVIVDGVKKEGDACAVFLRGLAAENLNQDINNVFTKQRVGA